MTGKTDSRLDYLFFFGRPFSPLYGALMSLRSMLYRRGIITRHGLEAPVISVGNLVLGGTGKTPLVHYIAAYLRQLGRKPAVLSRGYKGTAANRINIVSNPTDILLDAAEAGDEPRLLAEKLPGIPVITGKDRFAAGRFAIDSFAVDTVILDDGFQHIALKQDLDLVLFSTGKGFGNGRVLPGGDLREPLAALKRADAFVITGIAGSPPDNDAGFIHFLKDTYPEKPVFNGVYRAADAYFRLHGHPTAV